MARRQSFAISPSNPVLAVNLDWNPQTISILNSSPYTVYVNIGNSSTPNSGNHTSAVPPFSSYTAAPGDAISFGIFVDHAGDSNPYYAYPIIVAFSEVAGEVSAASSSVFPTGIPIATIIAYTTGQTGVNGTPIQFNRLAHNYDPGVSIVSAIQIKINKSGIFTTQATINISAMVSVTQLIITLFQLLPSGATKSITNWTELPAPGQATAILQVSKTIKLEAGASLEILFFFTGTSCNIDVGGTLQIKQIA